jgi:broad specificity phosphatase PhoE
VKNLIHIRHSTRYKPGNNLNQEGIDQAIRAGNKFNISIANIDFTITSKIARAIQTAVAMGISVNETCDELWQYGGGLTVSEIREDAQLRKNMLRFMNESISKIEEGQTLLMVSHGGVVASSLLSCVEDVDLSHLIPWFSYCEGFLLEFDGEWKLVELIEF